ncbi:DUF58 domain-containing protein [Gilvimarinus chinensis]|uniref:DUF58 domain-containing protein n=1 Tax=Gilvimarinus chinensis TaxID=396005 RepID=UPI00037E2ECE|nr:DUF58 domain-containing protein [Gilvimarinus chinensis]
MNQPASENLARGPYCDLQALLRERFTARELNLFARKTVQSVQSGRFRTRFRGRGVDFEEVRLYQAGDDIRSIDWRVTARTQVPHTKLYSEERERPVYILCDQRAPMFFGSVNCFKSTLACHIGAQLSWAALNSGDRIGSVIFGDNHFRDIRPKRSKHTVLQTLQLLHAFNHELTAPQASQQKLDLTQMLKDTRRIASPGAALFVLSDCHDLNDDAEKQLFHLARHLDITLIQITDPLEHQLRAAAALNITDGKAKTQLPAHDRQFQKAYAQQALAHQQALEDRAKRLGLEIISASTAGNYSELLRQRYGSRRRT